jgi:AraC family transcriptional regulator
MAATSSEPRWRPKGAAQVLTRAERLTSLPENVLSLSVSRRSWSGICVDVAESHGSGRVAHNLCYESETRLSVLLEENGSPCEPRLNEHESCPVAYTPRHMHLVPAGMDVWGFSADMRFVKDATLTFGVEELVERFMLDISGDAFATPRLRFSDDRTWTLVRLLAEVVNDPDPFTQLYGDGLAAAIVSRVFPARRPSPTATKGLTPRQLQRVLDYIDAHLPDHVELEHLAALVQLSQSHFSRAFKASTGMAPYRWQLDARIRRAQALLLNGTASLDDIAQATGFADGGHFGRTFRRLTGATPAAWRREQRR